MEPERIDLSPLALDPDRFETRVRAIMRAAAPELARRAGRDGVLVLLGQWLRPSLAAAAVGGVLATGAVIQAVRGTTPATSQGLVHPLGVAEPALLWVDEERARTVRDPARGRVGGARWRRSRPARPVAAPVPGGGRSGRGARNGRADPGGPRDDAGDEPGPRAPARRR